MDKKPLINKCLTIVITLLCVGTCIISSTTSGQTYGKNIIWENFTPTSGSKGLASQLDIEYPFNSQVADDFVIVNDSQVTGVNWWGVWLSKSFGGEKLWPNPCDFNIIFYADDGTGDMPTGAGMEDPTSTALAVYFMPQVTGTPSGPYDNWFEYNVTLPEPFNVTANTKYWIAIQIILPIPPQWGWSTNGYYPEQLHVAMQGFPLLGAPYWIDAGWGDMAFYLIGGPYIPPPTPKPDLDCNGELFWNDIKPGVTVSGSFQVKNIGEPGSLLNWTIESYPDWGTWAFTPSSGVNLKPDDRAVTVNVDVTAPDIKNEEFEGQVKVVNTDNSSDFCIIPVTLTTPQNHDMFYYQFFARLFEQFPYAFPILRQILDNKL